jgi:hypothetical protein
VVFVDVTVKVPEERIPEFYEKHGRWLDSVMAADPDVSVEPSESVQTIEKRADWSATEDVELAKFVLSKSSPRAMKVFEALSAGPVRASEMVEVLQLKDGSELAGILAWPGRYSKQVGRKPPVRSSVLPEGQTYWMEAGVAELFKKAQAELG